MVVVVDSMAADSPAVEQAAVLVLAWVLVVERIVVRLAAHTLLCGIHVMS